MSLEFDVYTLCHREAHVIETFLTAYADPDELARRHPGQGLEVERLFVGGLRRRRWIPVESVREAVELGLAHPDWRSSSWCRRRPRCRPTTAAWPLRATTT